MDILALNCGSSSVKYQLFNRGKKKILARGMVERVGLSNSFILHDVIGHSPFREEHECADHRAAIRLVIETLSEGPSRVVDSMDEITAVGHRVVHGGEKFTQSMLITPEVLFGIRAVEHLAPLHNPAHIAGIEATQAVLPDAPQVAVFDTAFHQTMEERSFMYALPYEWYEKYGVRRYGMHGTSHLYVSKRASVILDKKPGDCNLITLHVGNGSSFCAIKNGISVDTSMGMTPLEGAVMGTRCGDIDPAIPGFMMEQEGYTFREMDDILNKKSGILGVTGQFADRRDVLKFAERGNHRCQLALELETYRIKKYIGAYNAALGGVDAIVFTAGVGEMGWQIRRKALEGLEFMGIELDPDKNIQAISRFQENDISVEGSPIRIFVIPTNEELVLIEDVMAILEGKYKNHMKFQYSFARKNYKPGGDKI